MVKSMVKPVQLAALLLGGLVCCCAAAAPDFLRPVNYDIWFSLDAGWSVVAELELAEVDLGTTLNWLYRPWGVHVGWGYRGGLDDHLRCLYARAGWSPLLDDWRIIGGGYIGETWFRADPGDGVREDLLELGGYLELVVPLWKGLRLRARLCGGALRSSVRDWAAVWRLDGGVCFFL